MLIQPYLFFNGRAEEAAAFYQRVLGAKVDMMMRYSDSPDPTPPGMLPAGSGNKVMHMALTIGDTQIMGSDGECSGKTDFQGFSLSLTVKSAAEADRVFAALADGGQVQMPLGKTFFAKRFGAVADRFGVGWMVIVEA